MNVKIAGIYELQFFDPDMYLPGDNFDVLAYYETGECFLISFIKNRGFRHPEMYEYNKFIFAFLPNKHKNYFIVEKATGIKFYI